MKLIAICGGSCSGKSSVSKMLLEALPKSYHIDCDIQMFKCTNEYQDEIFHNLGVVKDPNVIDREYIFAKYENAKTWIKTIAPYIANDIENQLIGFKGDYDFVILDWAYLPLCSLFNKCDVKILVNADYATRVERIDKRFSNTDCNEQYGASKWKREILLNRLKFNQMISEEGEYDYYIDNNSDLSELKNQVKKLVNII